MKVRWFKMRSKTD